MHANYEMWKFNKYLLVYDSNCGWAKLKSCYCRFEDGLGRNQLFKFNGNFGSCFRFDFQIIVDTFIYIAIQSGFIKIKHKIPIRFDRILRLLCTQLKTNSCFRFRRNIVVIPCLFQMSPIYWFIFHTWHHPLRLVVCPFSHILVNWFNRLADRVHVFLSFGLDTWNGGFEISCLSIRGDNKTTYYTIWITSKAGWNMVKFAVVYLINCCR